MKTVQIQQVSTSELVELIAEGIKTQLKEFSIKIDSHSSENLNPHLTRKECATFFKISLNCLNDWTKKKIVQPYQVGQRIYFKRDEILQVMFNNPKRA